MALLHWSVSRLSIGMTRAGCLGKGMLLFPSTGESGVLFGLLPIPVPKAASCVLLGTSTGT